MLSIFVIVVLLNILGRSSIYGVEINENTLHTEVHPKIYDTFGIPVKNYIREKRQLLTFLAPKSDTKDLINVPRYKYRNGSNTALKYNYNNYGEKLNSKESNGIIKEDKTLLNNDMSNNQSDYKAWRAKFTWNKVLQGVRQNINKNNNGSKWFYSWHNSTKNQNNNSVNGSRRIFHPQHTYMPKFRHSKVYHQNKTSNNNISNTSSVKNFSTNSTRLFRYAAKSNKTTNLNSADDYKPYAPGYLPIPKFEGDKLSSGTHFYDNIDEKNSVGLATEATFSGCVICKDSCPVNHHRVWLKCVPNSYDY